MKPFIHSGDINDLMIIETYSLRFDWYSTSWNFQFYASGPQLISEAANFLTIIVIYSCYLEGFFLFFFLIFMYIIEEPSKEQYNLTLLKRIKYEIRLGEPNRSMSMGQKKVEPIICMESLTKRRPRLAHHILDSWRLALQGKDLGCKGKTCPTRKRLVLQG